MSGPRDWKRTEVWDGLGSVITTVEVPQTDMVRVPRAMFERILFEAGYTPDSLQSMV